MSSVEEYSSISVLRSTEFPRLQPGSPQGRRQICQILTDFIKKNFSGRFLGKFAVKWLLKVAPHLAYIATLLYEILNAENKRSKINYYKVIFKVRWGC